jgi:hypothetical protein
MMKNGLSPQLKDPAFLSGAVSLQHAFSVECSAQLHRRQFDVSALMSARFPISAAYGRLSASRARKRCGPSLLAISLDMSYITQRAPSKSAKREKKYQPVEKDETNQCACRSSVE